MREACINRLQAGRRFPLGRSVLFILTALLLISVAILGSSAVTIAQPPGPQPPGPQPPGPQPPGPQPPSEKPYKTKGSDSAGPALPVLLLFGIAAAVGVTWVVRRRLRATVRVSDVQLQERQTEGEQTEEEERRTSETQPVNVELELNVETQPDATVRVSGTHGVQYSGSYGNRQGRRQLVEARTLGVEPVDYPVELQSEFDMVSATFQKRSPGIGTLRVQILSEDQVHESRETTAEFGAVNVSWTP